MFTKERIEIIKKDVMDLIKSHEIKNYIENSFTFYNINYKDTLTKTNLYTIMFPIYHLFDNDIRNDIGSTMDSLKKIRKIFKFDELFGLIENNIHNTILTFHATLLYKINKDNKHYIYYSNSGFGIDNHICHDNLVSPNIYFFGENEELCNLVIEYIEYSLQLLKTCTSVVEITNYSNYHDVKRILEKIYDYNEILQQKYGVYDNFYENYVYNFIRILYLNYEKDDKVNEVNQQKMYYTLLDYMVYLFLNTRHQIIRCTTNHLLINMDDFKFINTISSLYQSGLYEKVSAMHYHERDDEYDEDEYDEDEYVDENVEYSIYDFFIEYNTSDNLYREAMEAKQEVNYFEIMEDLKITKSDKMKLIKFNKLINIINCELKQISSICPTLKKKLQVFKLEYNNMFGLFNNAQESGSCTFYSYFNLAINMYIINIFNEKYKIETIKDIANEIIDTFIKFHYIMIYLLCAIHDTKYINYNNKNYSENCYFNNTFLYKIICENNLLDEINNFYKSDTFIWNNKKPPIDHLLDIVSGGIMQKNSGIKKITLTNPFGNLHDYLEKTVNDIRYNKYDKTIFFDIGADINRKLDEIFIEIKLIMNESDGIIEFFDGTLKFNSGIDLIFDTLKEIILIYLLILIIIYSDEYDKTIISDEFYSLNYIESYDPKSSNNKCSYYYDREKYGYRIAFVNYTNALCINNLNKHEIKNISNYIGHGDIFNLIRTTFNTPLNYCKFIQRNKEEYDYSILHPYDYIMTSYDDSYCETINDEDYEDFNEEDYESIIQFNNVELHYLLFYKYINIIKIINNKKNNEVVRQKFMQKKIHIINRVRKIIKKLVYKLGIAINIFNSHICYMMFVATDGKYFISDGKNRGYNFLNILYSIQEKTLFYKIPLDFYDSHEKIKYIFEDIVRDDLWESDDLIKYYNTIDKIDEYICEYGFNLVPLTNMYDYESNKYIILEDFQPDKNILNSSKVFNVNFKCILSRFGINLKDKYILLFDNEALIKSTTSNTCEINLKYNNSYKCFVVIQKYDKCIEITFNKDNKVDKNECYLFEKINKDKKYKLIFDLDKRQYPFFSIIPQTSSYLCYLKDDNYSIDIICSSSFKDTHIMLNPKHYIKNNYYLVNLKIAPSLIFITNNVDTKFYKKLFKFYDDNINNICIHKYNNILNNKILIDNLDETDSYLIEYLDKIDRFTKILIKKSKKSIEYDSTNCKKFQIALSSSSDDKQSIVEEFIDDNTLCTNYSVVCEGKEKCKLYIETISKELKSLTCRIIVVKNFEEFLFKNLKNFLLIMCFNILTQTIKDSYNIKSCWDVQDVISRFKTINSFVHYIKQNTFYIYEILFLLQSEYFYKDNQIKKYIEIRKDLEENNSNLKLHQFMMGKGKTSVFTPLLSFGIKFLHNKQPTIITAEHLVSDTKDKIEFISLLTKIKVNVFSDFDAKKRWIENTDFHCVERQNAADEPIIDLSNEYNIIDEFDSHHNYLQSMFNYVLKNEKIIDRDMFNYIFDYVYANLKGIEIPINESLYLLNDNLNYFLKIANSMTYNKNYGFSFFKYTEEKYFIEKLCTPFVRKDTPVKNSTFSSILLTLILTLKTYIFEFGIKLQDFDFENLATNIYLLDELLDYDRSLYDFIETNKNQKITMITEIFSVIYKKNNLEINKNILKKYIFKVNEKKLNIASKQINMSFQDIIYNNYNQWQVGYSGTTTLKLNDYEDKENFVFREIIEDYDFKIEVRLALLKYGSPENNTDMSHIPVLKINKSVNYIENLNKILNHINYSRGIVDLAGLFLYYENNEIAKELKNIMKDKNIIYLSNKDEKLEYINNFQQIKFSGSALTSNFYYYDQCHTIGTDIKQPRSGHAIIIMDKNTRMTDFAQAIFRFRKINRGTYLSIGFIESDDCDISNNEEIYELLEKNEEKFNINQQSGLEYQLLKTIVRKETHNYLEDDLYPEFARKKPFNKAEIIKFMTNNIKNLNHYITTEQFIKTLYEKIILLDDNKLKNVICGIGNDTQTNYSLDENREENKEENKEENEEEEAEATKIFKIEVMMEKLSQYLIDNYNVVKHLNCEHCILTNCVKLFNDDTIQINKKTIYISFNFLQRIFFEEQRCISFHEICFNFPDKLNDRACFVELNDKIIIELESIAIDYYLDKLPVYDINGKIIEPNLANKTNKYQYILDIDVLFVHIFGIKNYINPNKESHTIHPDEIIIRVNEAIDNFTKFGIIILASCLSICSNTNRYNIANKLYDKIQNIDKIIDELSESTIHSEIEPLTAIPNHNNSQNDNLENVCFGINIYGQTTDKILNPLILSTTGYKCKPVRVPYEFNYFFNYDRVIGDLTAFYGIMSGGNNKNYEKYIKYKIKYLKLKKSVAK